MVGPLALVLQYGKSVQYESRVDPPELGPVVEH